MSNKARNRSLISVIMFCLSAFAVVTTAFAQEREALRPPAVPLVTHDPYLSVWSMSDNLTDESTKHWTGAIHGLVGMARIDGRPYRALGNWRQRGNPPPPPMKQVGLEVLPTRTICQFEAGGVRITLTFISPLLPGDLDLMSRPVTYIVWDVRATDGKTHDVSLYFDAAADLVVNNPAESVVWGRHKVGEMRALSVGSQYQQTLAKSGDDLRIDWGWLYLTNPDPDSGTEVIASDRAARHGFINGGALPDADDLRMPRAANRETAALATMLPLGPVGAQPITRKLILAYDDQFSIEYLRRRLRPYWRRNGMEAGDLLKQAARDYSLIAERCEAFDRELMADLRRAGGESYARLAALAFRQTIAAHKLVADLDGSPLFFSKENNSNGSVATIDVTYPSAPFFLLFNPALLRAQLTPVLDYAQSPRWRFPFAPHDLGTYPLANGQTYGGGETSEEDQMPVEECGNILLLATALAKVEGDAEYARRYWPLLSKWAEYLREKGMDPENQLSTDDFAGHLAHNTNLSLKAILALGGYAWMCERLGKNQEAGAYRKLAEEMAKRWAQMADDGDHFRLAFDKPGTWSQKYNLVWDRLLGLNLFPPEVARREIAFYKTKQNAYGLPLDNRESYTKLDWIVWTATLAESQSDFEAFIAPLYRFTNETPTRVPLTDWYWTLDGTRRGFKARSVVGGVYIKMLTDATLWRKWSNIAARQSK